MDARMTKEDEFIIGNNFNGHTLKNMSLITNVVNPLELLDKAFVASRRIPVDDYPPSQRNNLKRLWKFTFLTA